MKRAALLILMLFAGALMAQSRYVGTMTYGSYTLDKIEATMTVRDGKASISLYRVKFARMMPVRIDMDLKGVPAHSGTLGAKRVVPTSKGKPKEDYDIRDLSGTYSQGTLRISGTMNGKRFTYSGKAK